jgi:hypothetical protein
MNGWMHWKHLWLKKTGIQNKYSNNRYENKKN